MKKKKENGHQGITPKRTKKVRLVEKAQNQTLQESRQHQTQVAMRTKDISRKTGIATPVGFPP